MQQSGILKMARLTPKIDQSVKYSYSSQIRNTNGKGNDAVAFILRVLGSTMLTVSINAMTLGSHPHYIIRFQHFAFLVVVAVLYTL
ncbi:hypothetical protein F4859DRAFT_33329 [Xylaria cf. heliscus]|nr:hypothetical protein F4859DRAFT_33329 [Xylaria cf. heliscus]